MKALTCAEAEQLTQAEREFNRPAWRVDCRTYARDDGAGHMVDDERMDRQLVGMIEDLERRRRALHDVRRILAAAKALPLPAPGTPPLLSTTQERPDVFLFPQGKPAALEAEALGQRWCLGCSEPSWAKHRPGCRYMNVGMCRCMNMDGKCGRLHYADTLTAPGASKPPVPEGVVGRDPAVEDPNTRPAR